MALRGSVQEGVDTACARRSRMADIATLVEMQVALEEELFGRTSMDDVSLRELLPWQVRLGGASVAERGPHSLEGRGHGAEGGWR